MHSFMPCWLLCTCMDNTTHTSIKKIQRDHRLEDVLSGCHAVPSSSLSSHLHTSSRLATASIAGLVLWMPYVAETSNEMSKILGRADTQNLAALTWKQNVMTKVR